MNKAMTAPVLEPVGEGKVALQALNGEALMDMSNASESYDEFP